MRLLSCECERSSETTMSQAFNLVSGPEINELLSAPENRIQKLIAAGKDGPAIISELYWNVLSRPPTQAELLEFSARVAKAESPRQAYEDIAGALLNATDFIFRP